MRGVFEGHGAAARISLLLLAGLLTACGGHHQGSADARPDVDAGPPAPEVCGNGLDDDRDGDLDCADVDCLVGSDGAPLGAVASFADAVRFLYTDGACDAPQQGVVAARWTTKRAWRRCAGACWWTARARVACASRC